MLSRAREGALRRAARRVGGVAGEWGGDVARLLSALRRGVCAGKLVVNCPGCGVASVRQLYRHQRARWIRCCACEQYMHKACVQFEEGAPAHESEWVCAECEAAADGNGAPAVPRKRSRTWTAKCTPSCPGCRRGEGCVAGMGELSEADQKTVTDLVMTEAHRLAKFERERPVGKLITIPIQSKGESGRNYSFRGALLLSVGVKHAWIRYTVNSNGETADELVNWDWLMAQYAKRPNEWWMAEAQKCCCTRALEDGKQLKWEFARRKEILVKSEVIPKWLADLMGHTKLKRSDNTCAQSEDSDDSD